VNRLCALLAAAALLAACGKTTSRPAAGFRGMTSVAVFKGLMNEHPTELRTFVATANPLGDELKFVDALAQTVVMAPAPVGPLSVTTLPRPAYLAAASLSDGAAQADLLVVASGSPQPSSGGGLTVQLEVVGTWDPFTRVAASVDLGLVAPDGELLALHATPVPRAAAGGGFEPTPGRARVLAALTGGRLVTVEFTRGAGGAVEVAGAPVVQQLGFDAEAMASAQAGALVYAATVDPIPGPGGTFGVAELDASGAPGAFGVRALDARGPTVAVAALDVREFTGYGPGPWLDTFAATAAPRVFAALEPGSCGRDYPMPCGVVVLDPATAAILPDPAGVAEFMAPIQVPGIVTNLSATLPSAVAEVFTPPIRDAPPQTMTGLMKLSPGSGQRFTTGLIQAGTTLGRSYVIDPAHFAVATDVDLLRGNNRTRITEFTSGRPPQPNGTPYGPEWYQLGVWDERPESQIEGANGSKVPVVSTRITTAQAVVGLTPGFTNTERWTFTWQGILPGLGGRRAELRSAGGAPTSLAVQVRTGLTGAGGAPVFRDVARLYDPALAVHLGDLVVVDATAYPACQQDPGGTLTPPHAGKGGLFELVVTAIRPPDAAAPGGWLEVSPAPTQPANPVRDASGNLVLNQDGTWKTTVGDPTCVAGLGSDLPVTVSVRASGLVLSGTQTGYAGRPPVVDFLPDSAVPFELAWVDERTLPACPILPEVGDPWPPSAPAIAACEANQFACRNACERHVLSRRTRRLYLLTDRCEPLPLAQQTPQIKTDCGLLWTSLTFPFPTGPVLSLKVGLIDGAGNQFPYDANVPLNLQRDTTLTLSTSNGIAPASRQPYTGNTPTGAALPAQAVWYDRGAATGNGADSMHAWIGFGEGVLIDVGAGQAAQNAKLFR
jgi:hypothetical protein